MAADRPPPRRVVEPPRLPPRPVDAHKGSFGSVLVIAGSRGMAGAAALVGISALRSGAGLVRVATAAEVQPTVAGFEPSYMTAPLPQDADGRIDFAAARPWLEGLVRSADVVACGPGLGQSPGLARLVQWLLTDGDCPLVLDADGLNNLGGAAGLAAVTGRRHPVILTPHPGEFARLTGQTTAAVQADREAQALGLARAQADGKLIVLLKGYCTLVTDGDKYYLNHTGNPGMATGGVGDCLTGVIAALLAQGQDAFSAAALGARVHGLAGDRVRDQNGPVGLIASDIAAALPGAFYALDEA